MANELSNRFNDLLNTGDDLFRTFTRPLTNMTDAFKELRSDIKETDVDYVVAIDVPGIDKKDITIDFKDNILTVSAKRDSFSDRSDSQGNILASERSYGRYTRQYSFLNVDREKISAKCENGELIITLPKTAEEISNSRRIEIDQTSFKCSLTTRF